MPHLRFVVAICATLLSIAVLAPAAHAADGLTSGALYEAGPDGRYLMGGDWLFRLDTADQGLTGRFMRTTSTTGWTKTTVPNAWNATDGSNDSMAGSIRYFLSDGVQGASGREYLKTSDSCPGERFGNSA